MERELGRGATATVYLAEDIKHARRVALKVLRPELAAWLGSRRFLQEIRLAARLTHPHIVPVYDSGDSGGLLFYVMPYLGGETLRDRLNRESRLPRDEALRLGSEIAEALDYAHRQGIVHRDIKPENILLEDGHAVVTDFGIARPVDPAGAAHLTQAGAAIGTPMYMSPEQTEGEVDIDGRSDIYSLGCVLFEALAGAPPFTGRSAHAIVAQRLVGPPPRLRDADPDTPPILEATIAQAMATDPADRFANAAEFSATLLRLERGEWPAPGVPTVGGHGVVEASIAVLPFLNLSPDPENQYFSDGMTDEIINALAQVRGLRVVARTSSAAFKGTHTDAREIGRRLKVRTLLEGSVRKAGDRVRIAAQLINAADGYHLWSQSYERTLADVFAVQDELARAIASTLTRTVVGSASAPLVEAPTTNLDAYGLYLQGRHLWAGASPEAYRHSVQCFEQATALDPDYAEAHAWLGYGLAMLGFDHFGVLPPREAMPRAKEEAIRAIELDDTLGDAHFARALVAWLYDWEWLLAQSEFARATNLPGLSALAQHWYALFLCFLGHPDQGLQVILRAQVLDPLSVTVQATVGRCLYFGRRYDEAISRFHRHLEQHPESFQGYVELGRARLAQGHLAEGLAEVERGVNLIGRVPMLLNLAAQLHGRLGHTAEALALLGEIQQERSRRYVPIMYDGSILAAVGDMDGAFQSYEAAYEQRSGWLVFFRADPAWDLMRSDPRFVSLLRRLQLDP